jgi:hypothetical protein
MLLSVVPLLVSIAGKGFRMPGRETVRQGKYIDGMDKKDEDKKGLTVMGI